MSDREQALAEVVATARALTLLFRRGTLTYGSATFLHSLEASVARVEEAIKRLEDGPIPAPLRVD